MASSKIILPKIEIRRSATSSNPLNASTNSYLAKTSEVRLINYGKAYVNVNGSVFRWFDMMKDTYPYWHPYPKFYQRQKSVKNLYFKSKIHDFGSRNLVTVVDGGGNVCYYHWMWDQLVRINLMRNEPGDNFLLILPESYAGNNFCLKSLEMLGIKKDRIVVFGKREAAKSSNVFFPTWIIGGGKDGTTYDSEIVRTRNDLLDYCRLNRKLDFSLGERIFISRSRQKKRIILNQADVDELLVKYHFTSVCMEDLSFEDGISVSYNSQHTIAQCGSGLSNLIFQKPGSKVLELYPRPEYDYNHHAWFSELSQAGGIKHSYQYCKIDSDNIVINEFHTDMIVDLGELEKNIKLMLNN